MGRVNDVLFDDKRIIYNVDVRKNLLLLWSTRPERRKVGYVTF